MDKDIVNSLTEKDLEGFSNYLKKLSISEEASLNVAHGNVVALLDFMKVIEKNSDQLKRSVNLDLIKNKIRPSVFLSEYIFLEISNYYTKVNKMRQKGAKFPNVPTYWKILKDYRNQHPAHRDSRHDLKNFVDLMLSVQKLNAIGFRKIIEDFLKYHSKIKKAGSKKCKSKN